MKHIKTTAAAVVTLATLLGSGSALPALPSLVTRQAAEYAQLVVAILKAFGVAFPDMKNAWDYNAYPDMCSIKFETTDGGNCKASVTCAGDTTVDYNDWNVCYVGGRQYFHDDRIGDFSITFTEKDGQGQGLTNPILQIADISNWSDIPVSDLADEKDKFDTCMKGITTTQCGNFGVQENPWVCQYGVGDIFTDRNKKYECGMPVIGKGFQDFNSQGPVNDAGYAPGWCVAHITQYQKTDPVVDQYGLEVTIHDNNQDVIGQTEVRNGPTVSLGSKLPWTLEVQTGAVDADPVRMQYADQAWDSNDASRCSVGAYDSGSRQMDCGFTCN